MFSFDTKREPEKRIALCGKSYCLPSACRDAPLGQRQGGVFRLPPLPTSGLHPPATGQGLHALDKPKEEVEAQKASAAPVGAIALTLFFASPFIAPQSLRDSSPGGASARPQRRAFVESGAANAVFRYDPSRENSVWSAPQSATNAKLKIILPLNMPRVKRRAF